MKKIWFNNPALAELLENNGINLSCDENMDVTISDEDAARIPQMVTELAPYASLDYGIEEV